LIKRKEEYIKVLGEEINKIENDERNMNLRK